ncbi:hypothetical protein QQX98_003329 [Neonectria punicea]|uniref:Uncharacterized protein n=1 Tax=Neonectria punicea TaxID=979145 RepID=A0ABR1HEJ9_9HYPO
MSKYHQSRLPSRHLPGQVRTALPLKVQIPFRRVVGFYERGQHAWAVRDIPDPRDPDPERYACIPALLCLAFNRRIELGLPRHAPPILTRDMLDEWRAQEREYEEEPAWVDGVPRLTATLAIPHWNNKKRDFVPLESFDHASKEFSRKNILIWQPHIHFA